MRLSTIRWMVVSRLFGELFFYSTILVAFQHERGLSLTQMFVMESVLSASFWLFDIPTSVLADRIGHRKLLIVGRFIGVAGIVLFAFSHGFWLFCLAEVLGGMAMACTAGSESTLVYDALPEENRAERAAEVFSLLGSASSAGLFVGLFTGSFLGAIGPSIAVYASILPAMLAFVAMLRVPGAPGRATTSPRTRGTLGVALATVWRKPRLSLLSVFRSVAFVLTNAIFWYNQLYFESVGIPVVLYGPLMAGISGLQLLVMLRLSALQRRIGAARVLMLSCVVPGVCYALLAWTTTAVSAVALVAGIVMVSAWQRPVVETALNNDIADRSRATTLSALALVGAAAAALANPVVGWVGEFGLTTAALALGGTLIALGAVAPLLLRKSTTAAPAESGAAVG